MPLRSAGTLTAKEADAVEAAIEDELIALRVGPFLYKAGLKAKAGGQRASCAGCSRMRLRNVDSGSVGEISLHAESR
jgi:hypothetical protein